MKKISFLMVAGLLLGCTTTQTAVVPQEKEPKIKEVGEAASMNLLKTLKGELIEAMKQGGPDQAVEVCSKKAMVLTKQIESDTGYNIKRTTFKYRNPANKPDKYEEEALKYFEESFKAGKNPAYYVQAIKENDKITYRYYKPLKVEGVCLTCHGDPSLMDQNLLTKIRSLYPTDLAVGYKEGDFRGVVRVSIPEDKLK